MTGWTLTFSAALKNTGFWINCTHALSFCPLWHTVYLKQPMHAPGSFWTCQYTRGAQFAPGACSQIFNRLNIVEHFAGWKFCSRGWSVLMKSLVHTKEICSRSVPKEHPPGAKSLVSGAHHWWAPARVYRPFNEWQASIVYANVQDFFSLFPGIFFVQKQYICF